MFKLFTLDLINTQCRGKGFWKFINCLLNDFEYISLIKETLINIQTDFITENKNTIWEFAKFKIRTETMIYGSKKAKITKANLLTFEKKVKTVEKELENEQNYINHANYIQCKREWENILKVKAEWIELRSNSKLVEDGEKNPNIS